MRHRAKKPDTRSVNVHEAKTNFSRLLAQVETGEEILIARSGRPIAKIVPFRPRAGVRTPGAGKGRVWIAPDFDDPLPDDVLDSFE